MRFNLIDDMIATGQHLFLYFAKIEFIDVPTGVVSAIPRYDLRSHQSDKIAARLALDLENEDERQYRDNFMWLQLGPQHKPLLAPFLIPIVE